MEHSSGMFDKTRARKEVLHNLPPRHARGCPKNILRSVMWQLAPIDMDNNKRMDILFTLKDMLPCMCPKCETT